jgi:hypothetical protein
MGFFEFCIAVLMSLIFSVVWSWWSGDISTFLHILVVAVGTLGYYLWRLDGTYIMTNRYAKLVVVSSACVLVVAYEILNQVMEQILPDCTNQREPGYLFNQRFTLTGWSFDFIQTACERFCHHGDFYTPILALLMFAMVAFMQPYLGWFLENTPQVPSGHYLGPAAKIVAIGLLSAYWQMQSERNALTQILVHDSFVDSTCKSWKFGTDWQVFNWSSYEVAYAKFGPEFRQFESEVGGHLDTPASYVVTKSVDLLVTTKQSTPTMNGITLFEAGPIIWLALLVLTLVPNRRGLYQELETGDKLPVAPIV